MDHSQSDVKASTSGDLLSAALCAAGLDEFFVSPTSEDGGQQPSTSSATVEQCQEPRTTHTPLPGITASASTSPDLPINAVSYFFIGLYSWKTLFSNFRHLSRRL